MSMTPFTYYLFHRPTGVKYYGVRYANNCSPNDLWKTYFSSSKKVRFLIEEYGIESFDYQIRKVFDSKEAAISWEQRVLRRLKVLNKTEWLNANIAGAIRYAVHPKGMSGKKHSEETKRKLSEKRKGSSFDELFGIEKSQKIKNKLSDSLKCKSKIYLKGKTYEEIYGPERAEEIRQLRRNRRGHKVENFNSPVKKQCPHCNKLYDPGNLSRHLKRVASQEDFF
jgi:hypothetical protein